MTMFGRNDDDDLFGGDEDWDEEQELGIDYQLIDDNVVNAMGQGRAPIIAEVVGNPRRNPPQRKILQKAIASVKYDRANGIALIVFQDGSELVIRP